MGKKREKGAGWLSSREVACYGVGDLACSMMFQFMGSYLLFFYTDVAGVPVAAAGAAMSAARLIDAFANPVVGVLSDRTHSRWGKLRPYLLFSTVPLALSVIAVFLASQVPAGSRSLYALITYTLFCLFYTVCNVPYTAMMPNLSEDPSQRARLNRAKFICVSIGCTISLGFSKPLIGLFGGGDDKKGFLCLGALFAAIVVTLMFSCFAGTKERIQTDPAPFSLKTLGVTVKKSRPWVIYCLCQLFFYLSTVTRNSNVVYYAKYYLGKEDLVSLLLASSAVTTLATSFLIPLFASKIKKRTFAIVGYSIFIAGCLLVYFAGTNFILVFLCNLLANFGGSLANGVAFLILGETIDHSEYTTGSRQQGLLTSMSMFMTKIGTVFASLISAFVLDLGGYQADVRQTPAALVAIKLNFIFLPCIMALSCVILYLFYHLDDEYPKINAALREKHSRKEETGQ